MLILVIPGYKILRHSAQSNADLFVLFSTLSYLMIIASPIVWQHHFIWAIPGLFFTLAYFRFKTLLHLIVAVYCILNICSASSFLLETFPGNPILTALVMPLPVLSLYALCLYSLSERFSTRMTAQQSASPST
jgi:hypothetical protein